MNLVKSAIISVLLAFTSMGAVGEELTNFFEYEHDSNHVAILQGTDFIRTVSTCYSLAEFDPRINSKIEKFHFKRAAYHYVQIVVNDYSNEKSRDLANGIIMMAFGNVAQTHKLIQMSSKISMNDAYDFMYKKAGCEKLYYELTD